MKKVFFIVFLICCFVFSSLNVSAMANNPIKVKIDGKEIALEASPRVINGNTMVPLKSIFEALKIKVQWDKKHQILTGKKDGLTIVLGISNPVATINGKKVQMDAPATLVDGKILVPADFIADATGYMVSWDAAAQTVLINTASTEKLIKSALSGKDTCVFQIQNDFIFKTAAAKKKIQYLNTNGKIIESALPKETATNMISTFFKENNIIRVNAYTVTMDDNNFSCKLNVLEGNNGIKIEISNRNSIGGYSNVFFWGTIKGNTLTASGGVGIGSVVSQIASSMEAYGELTVRIKGLDKDHQPPYPVKNVKIKCNSDRSISVSWEDPNSKDSIKSYDIYRRTDINVGHKKVATVTSGSNWIDTSKEVKTDDIMQRLALNYYVVAHAKNGTQSIRSNYAWFNADDLFYLDDSLYDDSNYDDDSLYDDDDSNYDDDSFFDE